MIRILGYLNVTPLLGITNKKGRKLSLSVVVVVSHIQHIVVATEENAKIPLFN